MERKKTTKADLEDKRVLFLQIGFVVVLALVLFAFEWRTYEKSLSDFGSMVIEDIQEEIIPITRQEIPPPPQQPPPQTTILEIVEDDAEVEDDLKIDAEADQETEMQEYIPIEIDDTPEEEMVIFQIVEEMPSFPGGESAMKKYLLKNTVYPKLASESGIQGTVYITFVVEKDGSITGVQLLRGIGAGCDDEALRVVKNMPRWKSGKQRGKPVRVQFNLPIKFTLQG